MQCAMQGIPFQVEPEAQSYPLGRLNCDPPVALLRSVMEHMSRVANEKKKGMGRPEFVIFTGDIPSHQLSCQYHQARVIELVARLQVSHLMTEVGIWGGYNESSSKFIKVHILRTQIMRVQQRLVVYVPCSMTWSSGSSWSSGSGAEVIQMMAAGMKSVADKLYPAMGNNDSCHTLVLVKSDQIGSSRSRCPLAEPWGLFGPLNGGSYELN